MNSIKKTICLMLALVMVMGVMFIAPAAADEAYPLIKGTYTFGTFDGSDPGALTYYYSDSYFCESGKSIDPHLRTMSAALAFSMRGTSDTPVETFGNILSNVGFEDLAAYDLDHTAMDSMGVILGHKTINGKEVVAVALRGDAYEMEMAANMIAGNEGDIQAFADAEALIESRVSDYLEANGITAAKYWVVGYSRAGAVANLFGRELNRNLEKYRTTEDDIYVYAIEAALSSYDDTVYENIHNIVDKRDMVTYVYPTAWGVHNNGVAEYIGDENETITLKSLDLFTAGYVKDIGEVNTAYFINDFVSFITANITRETYAEKLQTPVSQILALYFSMNSVQQTAVIDYFQQVFSELTQDMSQVLSLLPALTDPTNPESVEMVTNYLISTMDAVAAEIGKPIDDQSYQLVTSSIKPIIEVLLPILSKDLSEAEFDPGDGSTPKTYPLYHILTFAGNLDGLFRHHFNYNVFNELTALDSYYRERTVTLGDVDGDGDVTIVDATVIQRHLAELQTESYHEDAADVDQDQDVTILDATQIQRFLADICNLDGSPKNA